MLYQFVVAVFGCVCLSAAADLFVLLSACLVLCTAAESGDIPGF